MPSKNCCQFKVWAFLKRNALLLTHDEYRAAHVGYHNSFGRRLNGIRGYLLNVRSNRDPQILLGEFGVHLNTAAPAGFDAAWSGYGQLMFDSLDDYLPEHKLVKLVLFARRRPELHPADFQARWSGAYCAAASRRTTASARETLVRCALRARGR